jgi:hypothetical protein
MSGHTYNDRNRTYGTSGANRRTDNYRNETELAARRRKHACMRAPSNGQLEPHIE